MESQKCQNNVAGTSQCKGVQKLDLLYSCEKFHFIMPKMTNKKKVLLCYYNSLLCCG